MAELSLKQVIGSAFMLWGFVCVSQICNVNGGGNRLLCGRDCSTACLNDACERFLYECKYGCKSGRNLTGCPKDTSTTPKPEDKASDIGVIIGAAAGVSAVAIIGVIVVAVIIVKRRKADGVGENSMKGYENAVTFSTNDGDPYAYADIQT